MCSYGRHGSRLRLVGDCTGTGTGSVELVPRGLARVEEVGEVGAVERVDSKECSTESVVGCLSCFKMVASSHWTGSATDCVPTRSQPPAPDSPTSTAHS